MLCPHYMPVTGTRHVAGGSLNKSLLFLVPHFNLSVGLSYTIRGVC